VFTILRNPVYKGQISYAQKLYAGKHEAIIPPKTFDAVQRLMDRNARSEIVRGRDTHIHLLKGLLKCGSCEKALTPYFTSKKDPKSGKPYLYYVCSKKNHVKRDHGCPLPLLPARALETTIKQFLKAVVHTSDTLHQALQSESKHADEFVRPLKTKRSELLRERKQVEAAVSNFLDAIGQKGIGSADLRSRYEMAVERRAKVDREVEIVDAEIAGSENRVLDLEIIKENLNAFDSVIDDLSLEDQKQLFQLFIKSATIWPHDAKNDPGTGLLVPVESGAKKHERIYRLDIELRQLPGIDPPRLRKLTRNGFKEERTTTAGRSQTGSPSAGAHRQASGSEFVSTTSTWAMRDSNPRPAACKAAAPPLS
jgi:hypothetical protein